VAALGASVPAEAGVSASYFLEDLTWPEVAARMATGTHSIIIPTGGTEQNGPHIALGKHNWIVRHCAGEIARRAGLALAAPVLAYVPEGSIIPAQGHMLFPGTISVSDKVYAGILEDTARSFKQHGFRYILFLGDCGGNQAPQAAGARRLSREWAADGVVVAPLDTYYEATEALAWARDRNLGGDTPQAHAGFMDASETLAVRKDGVRMDKVMPYYEKDAATTGAMGDPSGASADYGRQLLERRISAAVAQLRRIRGETAN
jgi:creatinine amidohydrolase/Fe(II)-dependent formamide hydrolase-like protein